MTERQVAEHRLRAEVARMNAAKNEAIALELIAQVDEDVYPRDSRLHAERARVHLRLTELFLLHAAEFDRMATLAESGPDTTGEPA
jgi:hypothetical protein